MLDLIFFKPIDKVQIYLNKIDAMKKEKMETTS